MSQYIAKRLLLMIPTLLGAAMLVFLLMSIVPEKFLKRPRHKFSVVYFQLFQHLSLSLQ